jgi:hypothetical protein
MWKIFLIVNKFINKTDTELSYKLTISCFSATIVAMEKQYVFHILSVYL